MSEVRPDRAQLEKDYPLAKDWDISGTEEGRKLNAARLIKEMASWSKEEEEEHHKRAIEYINNWYDARVKEGRAESVGKDVQQKNIVREEDEPLDDYLKRLLSSKDYPLAKDGILLSCVDHEEELHQVDDEVTCIALWADGTYCFGVCENNVESLFWNLDVKEDPFGVLKIWMYPDEETFGQEWSPAKKPLYHSKQDGGAGWQTSEEQMLPEVVSKGSKEDGLSLDTTLG